MRESAYLAASLAWLDALLALHIGRIRLQRGAAADDEFRGLYISEADVDALLAPPDPCAADPQLADVHASVVRTATLRARAAATDSTAPLLRLQRRFGLTDLERDVLLICLAPEIDLRYERLFAYAQDDVTRKRPSVDLALALLCPSPAAKLAARAIFAPDAPLRRYVMVLPFEDGQRHAPLLAQFLKLDERIVAELLGQPAIDPYLLGYAHLVERARPLDDLVLPATLRTQLHRLIAPQRHGGSNDQQRAVPPLSSSCRYGGSAATIIALVGGYGSGRQAVAAALCAELGLPLLALDAGRLAESGLPPEEAAARMLREARLREAALLLSNMDALLREERLLPQRAALLEALDTCDGLVFLALDRPWEPRGFLRHITYAQLELPTPSYAERERLWRARLNGSAPDPMTLQTLASAFRLSGGQIRDAANAARNLARARGPDAPITPADLFAGARAQSSDGLSQLARRVVTPYTWDDIVLPPDQIATLREIAATLRHRRTVYETWGFDRKLAGGKGLVVLFAGPSGTGKTMAASIVARDLGLELYAIDLAGVVSKYIGETEKNLDRIFDAARRSNAVLFFDEADSIFGKRAEVKDAHDRYANIEVGYLLQQLESYDGMVVLATNLRKNMDDAFVRRLHYAIEFPFPEELDRLRIWRGVFPKDAPLGPDVDLAFMARQFKIAGGNIRNIALAAAFLAAEDGTPIGMAHLVRATRREYQKLGKLVTAAEFGPYLALVRG